MEKDVDGKGPRSPIEKELEVLCRYVPRVVLAKYADSRAELKQPELATFTAVVALFDISGFSTLADKLAKEENLRLVQGHRSEYNMSRGENVVGVKGGNREALRRIRSGSWLSPEKKNNININLQSRPGMAVEQLTKSLNQTLGTERRRDIMNP
jgi:hypothetical protein